MEPKCFRMSDKKYAVVRHFFETTTIHGLPQVWSSETKCQKLIFFVAFLLCNGLSLYYCYKIVTQFVETPVATSYFVQEAEALRVPDITICPFTRFNYDFLHTHNVSDELIGYAELAFFDFTPTYDFVDLQKLIDQHKKERYQMERKLNSLLHRLNLTFEKFVDSASTHCSDVILYCVQGAQGHRYHNCCDQATTVITTMGKCFRIPGTMQSGGGFTQGMFVMLKLPLSPSSLPTSNAQMNDGVLVKLTEPGKGLDFDATMVPTGVHSLFQLRATMLDFINDPPRFSCNANVSPDYSPILCYERCMVEPMEQKCRCRYVGVQRDDNSTHTRRTCTPKDMLTCGIHEYRQKLKNDTDFATMCRLKCNGRCNFWQYHSTVSYANFPSRDGVWPLLKVYGESEEDKLKQFEEIVDRQMIIEVFFEKLEYTIIKHFASMTLYNFVANLGGQVGLWMGGSILSIVHLVVFIFLFLCAGACTKRPQLFLSFSKEPFLDKQTKSPR